MTDAKCTDSQNPPTASRRADPPDIGHPSVPPSSSRVAEASAGKKLSEILGKGGRGG
jgi:hypothetical protein